MNSTDSPGRDRSNNYAYHLTHERPHMASPKVMELVELLETAAARERPPAETPGVGTVVGSDSDFDVRAGVDAALHEQGTPGYREGAK